MRRPEVVPLSSLARGWMRRCRRGGSPWRRSSCSPGTAQHRSAFRRFLRCPFSEEVGEKYARPSSRLQFGQVRTVSSRPWFRWRETPFRVPEVRVDSPDGVVQSAVEVHHLVDPDVGVEGETGGMNLRGDLFLHGLVGRCPGNAEKARSPLKSTIFQAEKSLNSPPSGVPGNPFRSRPFGQEHSHRRPGPRGRPSRQCRPEALRKKAMNSSLFPDGKVSRRALFFEPCDGKACMALSCRVDPGDLVLHSVLEEGFLYFEDGIPGVVTINGFYLTVEGTEEKRLPSRTEESSGCSEGGICFSLRLSFLSRQRCVRPALLVINGRLQRMYPLFS